MIHRKKVHRRLFTEPVIFELEVARVFEKNRSYLGHEGEIPNSGVYQHSEIVLQPVIALRNNSKNIGVFITF
ncbi:MAG: hypothetical protein KUG54_01725 [Gammaproteobacteria bacterium]|nr:hypothetical protein [Gammaproteobacteria bacterium]